MGSHIKSERDVLLGISGVLEQAQNRNDLDEETVQFIIQHFNDKLDQSSIESQTLKVNKN